MLVLLLRRFSPDLSGGTGGGDLLLSRGAAEVKTGRIRNENQGEMYTSILLWGRIINCRTAVQEEKETMGKNVKTKQLTQRSGQAWTVIGAVLCVLFGFLLICNLTIIIKGTLFPEKPPSVLGISPMVVLSGSMSGQAEDHIEVGDLIFVGKAEAEELEVGDIIAYMNGGSAVTHRITAIETEEDGGLLFTTKGDANEIADTQPVTEEQLVGIYQGRIPKAGDFALFLQQPLGMLLFIGVPLLAFIIYDIVRRQRFANWEKAKALEMEAELERLRTLAGEQKESSIGAEGASH